MNDRNETIINAIIKKADALCPDSLALIGVYGSVVTGDEYEKSDLDLMVLIDDENGQVLADGFILDDVDIGYDIYCTSWDMLEKDAQCEHAHLFDRWVFAGSEEKGTPFCTKSVWNV